MERIKDLSKVILRGDMLLAEVVEARTGSGIILPDSVKGGFDYMKVVVVGDDVKTIEPGDIILDMNEGVRVTTYDIEGKKIALMAKNNVAIAVKADNFDPTLKKQKFTSKLIN
jgi:co-chaperonin GroES (HSP10)